LRALGEQYIERTRIHRKTDAPRFIDKMPNNFAHIGLIQLALPNAKIIDARRHPLACCFSNFKQHFARGQDFSYGLDDIGRYYRDYVELMAHFDDVLPGRVHRVIYERMVEDTEAEVRRCSTTAAAVRGAVPALLRKRSPGAHRQLRAGAPTDLPRWRRSMAPFTNPGSTRSRRRWARPRVVSSVTAVCPVASVTTPWEGSGCNRSRQPAPRHRTLARLPLTAAIYLAFGSAFAQEAPPPNRTRKPPRNRAAGERPDGRRNWKR
jgi:hypothetical protein